MLMSAHCIRILIRMALHDRMKTKCLYLARSTWRAAATVLLIGILLPVASLRSFGDEWLALTEDNEQITIKTDLLEAQVRKRDYVTGIAGGSFLDKTSGFRDQG